VCQRRRVRPGGGAQLLEQRREVRSPPLELEAVVPRLSLVAACLAQGQGGLPDRRFQLELAVPALHALEVPLRPQAALVGGEVAQLSGPDLAGPGRLARRGRPALGSPGRFGAACGLLLERSHPGPDVALQGGEPPAGSGGVDPQLGAPGRHVGHGAHPIGDAGDQLALGQVFVLAPA
jgi:hypothetical protein